MRRSLTPILRRANDCTGNSLAHSIEVQSSRKLRPHLFLRPCLVLVNLVTLSLRRDTGPVIFLPHIFSHKRIYDLERVAALLNCFHIDERNIFFCEVDHPLRSVGDPERLGNIGLALKSIPSTTCIRIICLILMVVVKRPLPTMEETKFV